MSVFIGICNSQEAVPSGLFWSFSAMHKPVDHCIFRSGHPWDVVRNNIIIHEFLKSGCDFLAKMDIDQSYPIDYFDKLLPLAAQHKVVGSMIYDRWEQNGYMPLAFDRVNPYMFPTHLMDLSNLSGVVEVPYPHTNLIYHRDVLSSIHPPWYEAYLAPSGLERLNHVDYTFINKIHKAGFKVMIDLDVEVKHMQTRLVGKANAKCIRNNSIL